MNDRCINIDWLEVYCLESLDNTPCDADFFRRHHFYVKEREYGTRQYRQMFTIYDDHDEPMYEIRRDPVAQDSRVKGMFDPTSCHVRLHNRQCYHPEAINELHNFLSRFSYTVVRIYRLDICLDFEKFDKGDDPQKFIERYISGNFSKVNQGNVSAHGVDRWDSRQWNSLAWGAPKSMVSTKMYDKTAELKQVYDKPYIRYAWFRAGLVNDWEQLTKLGADGEQYKPRIWRVEFSIRSSARGYYIVEDHGGQKLQTIQAEHTLSAYNTPQKLLHAFNCLQRYYFHFKYFQPGVRKDRCKDKVLFEIADDEPIARLDRLLTTRRDNRWKDALIAKLETYRETHADKDIRKACTVLITSLRDERMTSTIPRPLDLDTLTAMRVLLSRRIKGDADNSETISDVRDMVNAIGLIFPELNER